MLLQTINFHVREAYFLRAKNSFSLAHFFSSVGLWISHYLLLFCLLPCHTFKSGRLLLAECMCIGCEPPTTPSHFQVCRVIINLNGFITLGILIDCTSRSLNARKCWDFAIAIIRQHACRIKQIEFSSKFNFERRRRDVATKRVLNNFAAWL